jgi:hypothetical protein
MRIHPISGHLPCSYKFLPDGNLSLENEDMSGKMRTYDSPNLPTTHLTLVQKGVLYTGS